MVIDVTSPPVKLELGRQGENAVTEFTFDASAWVAEYGTGTLSLAAQRYGDPEPYPVPLEGGTWLVSAADTAIEGYGEAQLRFVVGEQVKKSVIYPTLTLPSIEATAPPPDPYETWFDEIIDAKDQAEQAVVDARAQVALAADEVAKAKDYAEDAAASAQAAASVFVFTDTGDGDIVITRSV